MAHMNATAMNLPQRDSACVWHPYTQMQTRPEPLAITHGRGVYLYTADGRRILDGISSWWVNIHGHAHPHLNAALCDQANRLEHVIFAACTHEPAVALAERLLRILPGGLTRVFYSDNGSTAVEVALKMAHQYWRNQGQSRRRTFVAFEHAYHGDTVGAMSVSERSVFTDPFEPMLFAVERVPSSYHFRCASCAQREGCTLECLASLAAVLEQRGDDVAGVIIEPMLQAAGGMITSPASFLAEVRRLCDQFGVLLIADEVLTGFGRTGRMFACEHADVRPDIICLSKALTAGYLPLSVTATTEAVYRAFLSEDRTKTFFHGHSFTANPLACAVALASLDIFEREPVLARVQRLEQQMRERMTDWASLPCVGEVRVIGGVGIVELVSDKSSRSAGGYLDGIGPTLSAEFLRRGVLLRPLGNVLYFMPPYVITDDEASWVLDQMEEALKGVGASPG